MSKMSWCMLMLRLISGRIISPLRIYVNAISELFFVAQSQEIPATPLAVPCRLTPADAHDLDGTFADAFLVEGSAVSGAFGNNVHLLHDITPLALWTFHCLPSFKKYSSIRVSAAVSPVAPSVFTNGCPASVMPRSKSSTTTYNPSCPFSFRQS